MNSNFLPKIIELNNRVKALLLGKLVDQHLIMILALILGFFSATVAQELVEEGLPPHCNCSRLLQGEETTTEPSPTFPATSFTCWGRFDGYYADVEVDCTIFHYCQTWQFPTGLNETVKWDFACPQSTIFNQKILSCTPPNISFDCQESPNYYWVNYNLTSTTTTTTPPPNVEFSTPVSNVGQQLIVGGVGPQSITVKDLERPTEPTNLLQSESVSESDGLPSEVLSHESASGVINFPF